MRRARAKRRFAHNMCTAGHPSVHVNRRVQTVLCSGSGGTSRSGRQSPRCLRGVRGNRVAGGAACPAGVTGRGDRRGTGCTIPGRASTSSEARRTKRPATRWSGEGPADRFRVIPGARIPRGAPSPFRAFPTPLAPFVPPHDARRPLRPGHPPPTDGLWVGPRILPGHHREAGRRPSLNGRGGPTAGRGGRHMSPVPADACEDARRCSTWIAFRPESPPSPIDGGRRVERRDG